MHLFPVMTSYMPGPFLGSDDYTPDCAQIFWSLCSADSALPQPLTTKFLSLGTVLGSIGVDIYRVVFLTGLP